MFQILTLNKISASGLSHLPKENFEITDATDTPDGVILRSFSMHDMALPKSLKAVARAGAGVNNIPIDKCSEQGIVVFNTPGANANAVKELVIAGLLLSSRRVVDGINWAQGLAGQTDVAKLVEKGKADFVGPEIMGKKLGVIGLGAIGVLVANACNSLGMEVYGFDPFVSVDSAWSISRGVHKAASLDEIYANCDYITVHVPFNKDTKGMIGAESIAKMKDGVRILNFARGELVDDTAIKAAVDAGKVSFYVTDFPNENLLGIKNIITVPHLGASSPESEENCAAMAAQELKEFLETGTIKNSVNFPNCDVPYTGRKRACITHRNVPSVLSALTSVFSAKKINIDNMTN
ncbi:MAG: 3-phosphoglycerate dehydrogenase, partial [Clostridiales bacterium]|nr:3-phosphoglycerate dehydrogenase [Clostridiales bacterium]